MFLFFSLYYILYAPTNIKYYFVYKRYFHLSLLLQAHSFSMYNVYVIDMF